MSSLRSFLHFPSWPLAVLMGRAATGGQHVPTATVAGAHQGRAASPRPARGASPSEAADPRLPGIAVKPNQAAPQVRTALHRVPRSVPRTGRTFLASVSFMETAASPASVATALSLWSNCPCGWGLGWSRTPRGWLHHPPVSVPRVPAKLASWELFPQ